MNKFFKFASILIVIIITIVFLWDSDPKEDSYDEAEPSTKVEKNTSKSKRPTIKKFTRKSRGESDNDTDNETVETPVTGSLEERKVKLQENIEELKSKLDKCRNEAEQMVSEKELQELESSVWDMEEAKKSEFALKGIENKILEKVGSLTSLNWHMKDFKSVTNQLMSEELATSDPEWTLKVGAELRPCGLYNTHRLLSLWTEMVPPGADNKANGQFIEESVVGYVRGMLNDSIGAAGVAMQVELLGSLADKGYFSPSLRKSIQDLENRLNEEMDMKFENSDGNAKDLVRSIIADHQDTERARQEVVDLLNMHFPNYKD